MLEHIDYWREAPVWNPDSIAQATKDWFAYLTPRSAGSPTLGREH
jgi:UDP-glucose 4-epimerase